MGQTQSHGIDPNHIAIWIKLIQIRDPATRASTLETVIAGIEYVNSAKRAGVYSHCLNYIAAVRQGRHPTPLPGEDRLQAVQRLPIPQIKQQQHASQTSQTSHTSQTSMTLHQRSIQQTRTPTQSIAKPRSSEKALHFFTACLRVLGIQEEIALTEDVLRSAYKRAAVKAHPDKGGTEEQFQAVTKAYAYLNDILRLVQGSRTSPNGAVPDLTSVHETRARQSAEVAHVEPVQLNAKNLNLTVFNQMFEQTRIPDPDEDGYGDWLTEKAVSNGARLKDNQKFGKDFNREVFNRLFEEDQRSRTHTQSQALTMHQPQALILSPTSGVELGRDRPPDYTSPYNANLKYTDLKQAYTQENTFSGQVAGIRAESRDFDSYRNNRERAPANYTPEEQEALAAYERQEKNREDQRRVRAAQEMIQASEYQERMKRLVLTNH